METRAAVFSAIVQIHIGPPLLYYGGHKMDNKSEKKAALYCRTARTDITAMQNQLDVLRQYAADNGLDYEVYTDIAD